MAYFYDTRWLPFYDRLSTALAGVVATLAVRELYAPAQEIIGRLDTSASGASPALCPRQDGAFPW